MRIDELPRTIGVPGEAVRFARLANPAHVGGAVRALSCVAGTARVNGRGELTVTTIKFGDDCLRGTGAFVT
jgi:hypothetical protein